MRNKKDLNALRIVYLVFFWLAFSFLVVTLVFFTIILNQTNGCEKTEATVTQIEYQRENDKNGAYLVISYTVDEKTYEGRINDYSDNIQVGSKIEVYYNTLKPDEVISIMALKIVAITFGAIAGSFIITCAICFLFEKSSRSQIKLIKANGKKLLGTIISIDTDLKVKVNGIHPIKLTVRDNPDFDDYSIYKSKNIYQSQDLFRIGEEIYIYKMDNNKYYVDTPGYIEKRKEA